MNPFLSPLENASNKALIIDANFDKIARSLAYLLTPSLDGVGEPTMEIGPPTAGEHVQDELWVDAALVVWRCTEAGTPGTWFPAVGYRIYRALLTQTDVNAPVATVFENTLGGEVVWAYVGEGEYSATLAGVFTADKTTDCSGWLDVVSGSGFTLKRTDSDTLTLLSAQVGVGQLDGLLNNTAVTILVYP